MNLAALVTAFGVVFLAELPDKTAIVSLILGTRYRPSWVFCGVAAAFVVHVALAVAAGSLLSLIPRRPLQAIVAVFFLAGAVLMLRSHGREAGEEEAEEAPDLGEGAGFGKVAGTAFGVIMVAEFGDLTQIVTANLAAKYADPLAVGLGAVLGLWAVAALAIIGGRSLLKVLPLHLIVRLAALAMIVLAGVSLGQAIAG
ncbi:TMEM165/GDT1 family protein [Catenulispora sp. NL8]|uniref:GDT1 family protein n=1 Tax=Catenulispora pinistramenti TaxID=2705254 RepID=A0ABS5KIN7_9ACTN|nr:TMEM165/GDT1 family protein [Catenulispora pinistramenti]MBS2545947.1 TMEM165/GDT1 family protein [Catenulispora pinistramenti]